MYVDYKSVNWAEVASRLNRVAYILKAENKEQLKKRLTVDMVYGVLVGMGDDLWKTKSRVIGWKEFAEKVREWFIEGHRFEGNLKK